MIFGTGDATALEGRAPRMESLDAPALTLPGVEVILASCEIERGGVEELFPPALQPTLPPLVTWQVWRCREGPLGAFSAAQVRLSCRAGARPRAFSVGCAIDNPEAGAALAQGWGYAPDPAEFEFSETDGRREVRVSVAGRTTLALSLPDLHALGPDDVRFVSVMIPAQTPRGLRLIQVDPDYQVERNERGDFHVDAFDAAAWGEPRIRPVHPLVATWTLADLTLPALRFVARPEVNAFEGTEKL